MLVTLVVAAANQPPPLLPPPPPPLERTSAGHTASSRATPSCGPNQPCSASSIAAQWPLPCSCGAVATRSSTAQSCKDFAGVYARIACMRVCVCACRCMAWHCSHTCIHAWPWVLHLTIDVQQRSTDRSPTSSPQQHSVALCGVHQLLRSARAIRRQQHVQHSAEVVLELTQSPQAALVAWRNGLRFWHGCVCVSVIQLVTPTKIDKDGRRDRSLHRTAQSISCQDLPWGSGTAPMRACRRSPAAHSRQPVLWYQQRPRITSPRVSMPALWQQCSWQQRWQQSHTTKGGTTSSAAPAAPPLLLLPLPPPLLLRPPGRRSPPGMIQVSQRQRRRPTPEQSGCLQR